MYLRPSCSRTEVPLRRVLGPKHPSSYKVSFPHCTLTFLRTSLTLAAAPPFAHQRTAHETRCDGSNQKQGIPGPSDPVYSVNEFGRYTDVSGTSVPSMTFLLLVLPEMKVSHLPSEWST